MLSDGVQASIVWRRIQYLGGGGRIQQADFVKFRPLKAVLACAPKAII